MNKKVVSIISLLSAVLIILLVIIFAPLQDKGTRPFINGLSTPGENWVLSHEDTVRQSLVMNNDNAHSIKRYHNESFQHVLSYEEALSTFQNVVEEITGSPAEEITRNPDVANNMCNDQKVLPTCSLRYHSPQFENHYSKAFDTTIEMHGLAESTDIDTTITVRPFPNNLTGIIYDNREGL